MTYTTRDETPNKQYEDDDSRSETPEEGQSSSADKLPGAPAPDDDSPLGDTDQHSDA